MINVSISFECGMVWTFLINQQQTSELSEKTVGDSSEASISAY